MHFPKLYREDLPLRGKQPQTPIRFQTINLSRSRRLPLRPDLHLLAAESQAFFPGVQENIRGNQAAPVQRSLEDLLEQIRPVERLGFVLRTRVVRPPGRSQEN